MLASCAAECLSSLRYFNACLSCRVFLSCSTQHCRAGNPEESRGVQSPPPRAIPAADPWLPQGWERHRSPLASLTSSLVCGVLGRAASSGLEGNFSDSEPLLSKPGHIWRHNVAMQLYQQIVKQPNLQHLPCTSLPISPLDKSSQCPQAAWTDFRKGTLITTASSMGRCQCKPHGIVLVQTFCKGCGLFSLLMYWFYKKMYY